MSAPSLGLLRVADFLESQSYTESARVVRDAFTQLAHYETGAEMRIEEDKQEAEKGSREMNNLGQPSVDEINTAFCDKCNALLCVGCPVSELQKLAAKDAEIARLQKIEQAARVAVDSWNLYGSPSMQELGKLASLLDGDK